MSAFQGTWRIKKLAEDSGKPVLWDGQDIVITDQKMGDKDYLKIAWQDADTCPHEHLHELTGNAFAFHGDNGDYYNLRGHFENLGGLKILVGHARLHTDKHYFASITGILKA